MGTQSPDPRPSTQLAAANGSSGLASVVPAAMPLSIAPKALAQHLDDGWGDETDELESGPAAATSKLDALAKASVAAAKASNAVSAIKARKAAAQAQGSLGAGAGVGLPRAAQPATAAAVVPESTQSVPPVRSAPPAASNPPVSSPLASNPPSVVPSRPLNISPVSVSPASMPPPVEEDSDWDVAPSEPAAVGSIPTVSSTASDGTVGAVASKSAASQASPAPAPLASAAPALTKSDSGKPESVAPKRSVVPAPRVSTRPKASAVEPQQSSQSFRPTPKSAASAAASGPAPVESSAQATETIQTTRQSAPPPAIDITIEPSFPQVVTDADGASAAAPAVAARPEVVTTSIPPAMHALLAEPVTSMSPVTATSRNSSRPRSKIWVLLAASIAVVGVVWGIWGADRVQRPPTRKGQTEPIVALEAAKAPEPAQPVQAEPPPVQPEQVAAQPPPTGTADDAPSAPEPPAAKSLDANSAKRLDDNGTPHRGSVTAAAAPKTTETAGNAPAQAPAPAIALGNSSPSVNSPVTPQSGIVDPRAFPSSQGAIASKVRVEIEPYDTKIAVNGRTATPPYVFDVPKGTRVVLEVARPGYITRRIVLDGSRELVRIGMIPEPKSQETPEAPKAEAAPKAPKTPKADPPKADPGPAAAPEDL